MIGGLTSTTESATSIALDFYHHETRMGMLTLPIVVSRSPAIELQDSPATTGNPTHAAFLRDGPPPPSLGMDCALQLVRLLQRSTPPSARIVELHCGEGWLGRRLVEAGFIWHGLERQADACHRMLARGQPHTRIQDDMTPFESGGFDLALIADFSTTLLDPTSAFSELRRIAPRALAVVTSLAPRQNERFSAEQTTTIKNQIETALRSFYTEVETLPFGERVESVRIPADYTHLLTLAWKESA